MSDSDYGGMTRLQVRMLVPVTLFVALIALGLLGVAVNWLKPLPVRHGLSFGGQHSAAVIYRKGPDHAG